MASVCAAEVVRIMNKAAHVLPRIAKTCNTPDLSRGGHMYPRKLAENVLHLSVIGRVKGVHSNFRSELIDSNNI